MFKLYFSPGACSISPHIALREAGIPFELVRVDLMRGKKLEDGRDLSSVNPKNYVPALVLGSGELLTEGVAIVQYIADQKPESGLAPANGTLARVRLQEMLNFIATELHKGLSPLFSPLASDEFKEFTRQRFAQRLEFVAENLGDKPYLMGDTFTVADGYLFFVLRTWVGYFKGELPKVLASYMKRVEGRPAVKAALVAEGFS